MAITLETNDGPVEIPDAAILAVTRNAEMQADLTAAFLDATGLFPKADDRRLEPVRLPAAFLLELGAVLQLGLWEMDGTSALLKAALPSSKHAAEHLTKLVTTDLRQLFSTNNAPLSRRLLQVWLDEFGWDARAILHADVVVGDVDEDGLVEALARLLWEHRHDYGNAHRNEQRGSE